MGLPEFLVGGLDDGDDGHVGGDWPIGCAPPIDMDSWRREIVGAFLGSTTPPRLVTDTGATLVAKAGAVAEAAVLSALRARGVAPPTGTVRELIDTIELMATQLQAEGPQWSALGEMPALQFAISYVWTHLGIGAISENTAADVMQSCADRLHEFSGRTPSGRAVAVNSAASRS
jgi:hypothetical protein